MRSPEYKGDGNCDDENNNCGCEFDGGTAVRNLSRAERSKQLTANSASARIPSTLSKAAKPNARFQITLAMATATTRTTTVPADTIKATAAVKMSKKPTARSANARTRNTRSNWIRSF